MLQPLKGSKHGTSILSTELQRSPEVFCLSSILLPVTHATEELPLKRVYAHLGFKEEECPPESPEVTVTSALYKVAHVCICKCVCVCALSSSKSTAMLFWPNASHFMPWRDCSRYSFCTDERAEIMCVFACASVCLCAHESLWRLCV